MMPYSVSTKIKKLVRQLELDYGDYAKYTETLDALHTFIINEAQAFKPKRTYKKKAANEAPKDTEVVRPPSAAVETAFPDDRVDAESGGQE